MNTIWNTRLVCEEIESNLPENCIEKSVDWAWIILLAQSITTSCSIQQIIDLYAVNSNRKSEYVFYSCKDVMDYLWPFPSRKILNRFCYLFYREDINGQIKAITLMFFTCESRNDLLLRTYKKPSFNTGSSKMERKNDLIINQRSHWGPGRKV